MNDMERSLLSCVCDDNLDGAKKYARAILLKDKAKTNERFRENMLRKLDKKEEFVLPATLKGLLFLEDPEESFQAGRYYLSSRESAVAGDILRMSAASQKLAELGVNYVNTTMLYGESGTGKTTFGKYIAYRLGLPFAYVNYPARQDMSDGA